MGNDQCCWNQIVIFKKICSVPLKFELIHDRVDLMHGYFKINNLFVFYSYLKNLLSDGTYVVNVLS